MTAVSPPLYGLAIPGIMSALEEVRATEAAISEALDFEISKHRWRPWIESRTNTVLVNLLLAKNDPDPNSSRTSKMHSIKYNFDMYVRGEEEDLQPADEAAVERLIYLTAQVESALTAMKNDNFGLDPIEVDGHKFGLIDTNIQTTTDFYMIEGDRSATSIYAPARTQMTIRFPYWPEDQTFPDLETVRLKMLENWYLQYDYTL